MRNTESDGAQVNSIALAQKKGNPPKLTPQKWKSTRQKPTLKPNVR